MPIVLAGALLRRVVPPKAAETMEPLGSPTTTAPDSGIGIELGCERALLRQDVGVDQSAPAARLMIWRLIECRKEARARELGRLGAVLA